MENNDVTKEEQAEYLAYHTYVDVLKNFETGIAELERLSFEIYRGKVTLLCGGMVAFDKGLTEFLNRWNEKRRDLFLLSEVTAQHRRYTGERIHFPFLCTPHLLSKEMIITQMEIPVEPWMEEFIKKKTYLREATDNLNARHKDLGKGYAIAWSGYAYRYICKFLELLEPKEVVLWNEFYAFHHIFRGICMEQGIRLSYMEFGCIPGTICIEKKGQQGESVVARHYRKFRKKRVSKEEIKESGNILSYLYTSGLNRNIQPEVVMRKEMLNYYKPGRKTIFYAGQNDFESGLYPYIERAKKNHSPVFSSTFKALEYLEMVCIKNNWNLIYKPHPSMMALGHAKCGERTDKVDMVDVNTVIDFCDVTVTILSQMAYIALIRKKPVVMLGYTQLRGKKCTYEAFQKKEIEKQIRAALEKGFEEKKQMEFQKHVAQLLKYYLYDDGVKREYRFGKKIQ